MQATEATQALVAMCALNVAMSAALAAVFSAFARQRGELWLRRWALGWTLMAVAVLLISNDVLGRPVPHVQWIGPPLSMAATLVIVAGAYAFAGRSYSHAWTVGALVGAAGTGALNSAGVDLVVASTPAVLVLSASVAWSGWLMLPHAKLAGVTLVLWALHGADYPLFGDVEWFKPWGLALSAFLQLGAAIGLLLAHLERSQAAITDAAEQERALIEHADVGIFRLDAEGRFTLANPATLAIVDYPDLASLRADRDVDGTFVDEADLAAFRAALGEPRTLELVALWRRRDGSRRRVRLRGRGLAEPGRDERFEGFVVDITERARLEAELDASRRLQAVGRLTGGIAHDFNNLLTVIQGNLLLGMSDPEGPLGDALHASERAAELTRQLLSFARAHASASETADLVPRVEILARLLRRTLPENVHLSVRHQDASRPVEARPTEVDQLLLNLVVNARDALRERGGTIAVSTGITRVDGVDWAQLRVEDDGPGIPESVAETLFEPFATGGEGSGLGLTIVRDLAERRGGRVEVTSAPGEGTTFVVWLRSCGAATPEAPAPIAPPPGTGRVLVVDDDASVLDVTARHLSAAGYEVVRATGVAEAKARLDASLVAVVSDVMLADGNGFTLEETLEARGLEIPCVFVSGYPDQAMQSESGDHVVLPKPYRPELLLTTLAAAIERGGSADAAEHVDGEAPVSESEAR
ncbi:MAG: ATP-binding protein [Myxococcota bacterium]|nr:ATP-binding protein [Myxococcota bacterium]